MRNKNFLYVLSILAILTGGYWLMSKKETSTVEPVIKVDPSEIKKDDFVFSTTTASLLKPTLSEPASNNTLTNQAWSVLEKYLESAKAHNLANLRTYSHQISDTCNDPAKEKECFVLMDNVYFIASQFKKEDFKNIWYDAKQIILSTDYKEVRDEMGEPVFGLTRSILYFTRSLDGTPKLLSLKEFDGAFVQKRNFTDEQVWDRIRELIKDSDEDGLANDSELCLGLIATDEKEKCTTSDPKVRDTDGDGWWDGIEYFFYKR